MHKSRISTARGVETGTATLLCAQIKDLKRRKEREKPRICEPGVSHMGMQRLAIGRGSGGASLLGSPPKDNRIDVWADIFAWRWPQHDDNDVLGVYPSAGRPALL
ncbi:hypothetical protein AOLI_G00284230 [Acnodon oligacanthus]